MEEEIFVVLCDSRFEKAFRNYPDAVNYIHTSVRNITEVEDIGEIPGYIFRLYSDSGFGCAYTFEIRKSWLY